MILRMLRKHQIAAATAPMAVLINTALLEERRVHGWAENFGAVPMIRMRMVTRVNPCETVAFDVLTVANGQRRV